MTVLKNKLKITMKIVARTLNYSYLYYIKREIIILIKTQ